MVYWMVYSQTSPVSIEVPQIFHDEDEAWKAYNAVAGKSPTNYASIVRCATIQEYHRPYL